MRYVTKLRHVVVPPHVHHCLGMPPLEHGAQDGRNGMAPARFLLIEPGADGVFLIRHSETREFCGDTWHENVADAKRQAEYEFGSALQEWSKLPEGEADWISFTDKHFG